MNEEEQLLYSKNGFNFVKKMKNYYSLTFQIENNFIQFDKIIDFSLVKLIYELNTDIYERCNIQHINENEVIIFLLLKHLFKDIGLPQRYSYLHTTKIVTDENIYFISRSIDEEQPDNLPSETEQMHIEQLTCLFENINTRELHITCSVLFNPDTNIPVIAEKLVGLILYKIFNRVKQFIENIRM